MIDALLAVAIFVLGLTTRVDVADAGIGPFSREPDVLNLLLIGADAGPGRWSPR